MPEPPQTNFDRGLDRAQKIANILLPLVIALLGIWYSYTKDKNDERLRAQQAAQDLSQKQYANVTALMPLLLSKDPASVSMGMAIYIDETNAKQAPDSLKGALEFIQHTQPEHMAEAQAALQGAELQSTGKCKSIPSGLFIQVANDTEQLKNGRALQALLKSVTGLPPVQGVQRVDSVPQQPQLRYYFTDGNNAQAAHIVAILQEHGFKHVELQISQNPT